MGRRWKALILAVIPGFGHLYVGRHWRGLLVFAVFALAVNGMYVADVMDSSGFSLHAFSLCRGAAVAMVAYSLLHVAYLSKRFERQSVTERKDYHFKRGLAEYLAGAFDVAKTEFDAVLKLDPMDVDARFHLAMTEKALGRRREAVRAFKRCLADDLDSKWKWEIETQLKALKEAE